MRAVVQVRAGEPVEALSLVDLPDPDSVERGEILIKIVFASLHHGDLFLIRSTSPQRSDAGPLRRGSEAYGIVEEIGWDVPVIDGLVVGARVATFITPGVWAEKVTAHYSAVYVIPPEVSDAAASHLLLNSVTARLVLRTAEKALSEASAEGGVLLQTGAGTSIGRMLSVFAAAKGLPLIGLVRSPKTAATLSQQFPASPYFVTNDPEWPARVLRRAAGKPIPVIIDCVGGRLIGDLAPLLADGGTIVVYGGLAEGPIGITSLGITHRGHSLQGVTIGRWRETTPSDLQKADIEAAITLGKEHPELFKAEATYPLENYRAAVEHVELQGRTGLVLFRTGKT